MLKNECNFEGGKQREQHVINKGDSLEKEEWDARTKA
jgi:hypothetical protein